MVMVLVAHPRPDSFNHALARAVGAGLQANGYDIAWHDLYAEQFDPILRPAEAYTSGDRASLVAGASDDPLLQRHRRELQAAMGLVVVHPNWWGKPPAMLAGWLDRVLVPGVAYQLDDGGGLPLPLVQVRRLLIVNTGDTPPDRERDVFGDPLERIWRACIAPYIGDPVVERVMYAVVAEATEDVRKAWLEDVVHRIDRLFPAGHG
jgi:NAD(P)H dehydrogenase (quinone)